jgi:two-component system cell cycle response regulator DivK
VSLRDDRRSRLVLVRSPTVVALLPKFVSHRERDIVTVRDAIIRRDFATIATIGHNLRGSAESYGFPQLSAFGERLEAAAHRRDARRVDLVLEGLEACVRRIRVDIGETSSAEGSPSSETRLRVRVDGGTRERATPLVLVVDDFEDTRAIYAECLGHAGYGVIEAENGLEAVEKARDARPDVVVMDLSLPILDGWEATRRLKGDPRTKEIRVIVLTGHGLAEHARGAEQAGCDAFLVKPCLPRDLLGKVRSMLPERGAPPDEPRGPKSLG